MSTLKADGIEASTGTNTDLTLAGKGTGVPDLAAGFKVGSVAGVPTASIRDDAVTTAKIVNDAVTLAKLAAGTDGELITWDASGDPAAVAVGTATHVLTSNGAGAAPTFQAAGGGGAWTLIGTSVASASATLTITGLDSTYDTYGIAFSDMVPATDTARAWIRVGDSSGVDSGAGDYSWRTVYNWFQATTYASSASIADNAIHIADNNTGNQPGEGFGGMYYLHRPGDGTMQPIITGSGIQIETASGDTLGTEAWGLREAVITLDRIQFLFSSGNVATGRMTVWGISHA